ncbi:hypothetical protein CDAR_516301 [Caerostris darwini]|uniref:Uncharacterized protein n=1 Tax=Caerostris darwini TaxID=1538125 RepID=A0AAV4X1K6_9ARAC|nr:hypothetical protein CDAR_516301 [Caerostris darwini]
MTCRTQINKRGREVSDESNEAFQTPLKDSRRRLCFHGPSHSTESEPWNVPEWRVASILSETNQDHCLIKWQFTKDPNHNRVGKSMVPRVRFQIFQKTTVNLKGSRCIPFHSDRGRNSH